MQINFFCFNDERKQEQIIVVKDSFKIRNTQGIYV